MTMPVSMRFDRVVITVALAGMLTPAARVSVAKTTCNTNKGKQKRRQKKMLNVHTHRGTKTLEKIGTQALIVLAVYLRYAVCWQYAICWQYAVYFQFAA